MTPTDDLHTRAHALGLWGLLAHWDELDSDDLSRLAAFIAWEEHERARRSQERRLANARIGRFKAISDFDWTWPTRCDRDAVRDAVALRFVNDGANALIVGPNGTGKTTIAKNIAYQGVLDGFTVRFTTASEMLNDLAAQDGASALQRRLARYTRPRLLAIDELGYLSYGNRHADLLFEVVSRRYGTDKSTLVTTNKPFSEWAEVFPNATCVVTLVDRLIHRCDIIEIEGESYRLKEARERAAKRRRTKRSTEKTDAS